MKDYEIYNIPHFTTQNGITLDIKLAYKTYGELSKKADNAIVIPTFYGGRHTDTEYLFGPARAIDTNRYFVIVPNMFGNGYSTSPSNTAAPYGRSVFPLMTLYDNAVCQHKLVTEHLGVERIKLVSGFSMGAAQTFQWGVLFPEQIDAIAPICGAARIAAHNHVFVESAINTLKLDVDFKHGWYESPPIRGILTFGHVYAAWLFSQDFFREKMYTKMGLASPNDVIKFTQNYFLQNDANDLVAMAHTWLTADVSANDRFNGAFDAALASATCRAIVMPSTTDLYFRVADSAYEVTKMPNAELRPIESKWGHGAGFGIDDNDSVFVDTALGELLN